MIGDASVAQKESVMSAYYTCKTTLEGAVGAAPH